MGVDALKELKSQVIDEMLKICHSLGMGLGENICYQDTMNKILFIENYKDLLNRDRILNSLLK